MSSQDEVMVAYDSGHSDGFLEGYLASLYNFAWWKDGTQYVGCGNKTYAQAKEEAEKKYG